MIQKYVISVISKKKMKGEVAHVKFTSQYPGKYCCFYLVPIEIQPTV